MDFVDSLLALGVFLVPIVIIIIVVLASFGYRKVVPTNMVHIVQSAETTTSYGKDKEAGNVYYAWPSFLPRVGVSVIQLPVSNFEISLKTYEAYDADRVPFVVDVTAFLRVDSTDVAAQRVTSMQDLEAQLTMVVQGAVRKVLASNVIDKIMTERSTFGEAFTEEVKEQLEEWGVTPVKSMELMDIRDSSGSQVIQNIMAKKISEIEKDSRVAVAINTQAAEMAEVQSQQAIDLRKEEAAQAVGERTAQREQAVGIAQELHQQEVLEQQKVTRERDMEVRRIQEIRQAEITRDQEVVRADQDKQTQVLRAEGQLEAKRREAEGIKVEGTARADAEKAMQLAPVEAQITLAKEIGGNEGYQTFLATTKALETHAVVGTEQARALQGAEVKVIANAGNPSDGMSNVMDLFTSQGGTNLAAMVEAFAQTPLGNAIAKSMVTAISNSATTPAENNGQEN